MTAAVRISKYESALTKRANLDREQRDRAARERVRRGDMSLDDYLCKIRGYRPEHADALRERFAKAIFG